MTNLFIAYVAVCLLPLLFHSRRVAVLGLGMQGLLLGLILAAHHHPWSSQLVFEYASLFLIRALFLPWYLFRSMQGGEMAGDFSVLPKNLVHWTIALLLLVGAFTLGGKLSPGDPLEALQVGTASGSILIGLLVLASQAHPLGQVIGLFMLEGGITLVELLSPHPMPFPVSIGVSLVFVVLVLTCGQYLRRLLSLSAIPEKVEDKVLE
jgi:hydrogenase-4 membrane subunit HyfE